MRAHNDVTDAFRRTTTLMQQELEKSVLTAQLFGTLSPPHLPSFLTFLTPSR